MADGKRPGNLKKAVEVIVDFVRGEGDAKGKPFPENFPLEEIVTIQSKMSCRRCCGTWMNGRRSSVSQITRMGFRIIGSLWSFPLCPSYSICSYARCNFLTPVTSYS